MRRRSFLQAGAGAPAVQFVRGGDEARFTTMPLGRVFNTSAREFGPRPWARNRPGVTDNLIRTLGGLQTMRGVPFELGPGGVDLKTWVVLGGATRRAEVEIGRTAGYLCLAQFCDWERVEFDAEDVDAIEGIGNTLAEAVLVYDGGEVHRTPIRRRFEVGPPAAAWGRECFHALQSNSWRAVKITDPLERGTDWGMQQQEVLYDTLNPAAVWIWALENPGPERVVRVLRLESKSDELLAVCGLTLYHGRENPLRHERRRLYRITLPEAGAAERWKVEVDLGLVVRQFTGVEFDGSRWLHEGMRAAKPDRRHLYAEITASNEAAIGLRDLRSGALGAARVEVLEPRRVWVKGRLVDGGTGRTTAARLAFRSKEGRYIPPYGHRQEVNTGWFQDYGADVAVGPEQYAYVDGTFQVELPAGEVYVEFGKGFEYEATRRRLEVRPEDRELELKLARHADWRNKGWVTADTHVHFLSPSTALLEAQAEGLNLVNLLAAQWGDLYTNIGDLAHGSLATRDGETRVEMGTENRQHLLGHLGLLGGHGEPVFPMSGDGPSEALTGDPLWSTMSEWAERCRAREGVVIAVHFPMPNAEMAAEIVRGKVDAVELYPRAGTPFRTLAFQEWYRYLNCGYRVAAAGGTDKMSAATPVGANRTYAHLGGKEFSFANWAEAVRAGRTFSTTGPLVEFEVEGKMAGGEIRLRSGGGELEVKASATCGVPFQRLEVVWNGKVVAWKEEAAGTRSMALSEKVRVPGPGWLAARCSSRMVAAHTSPVYVVVPGEELFSAPAAAYFLRLIEGTELYVDKLAVRAGRERMEQMRKTLREAHALLHARGLKHRH
jgi:hypothetical protein